MKINNIQQTKQNNKQNFRGNIANKATKFIAQHPAAIATLAGSSVIAQKIVMSGSEAVIGPVMDVGIGKTITKISGETDGRTNESSKTQAIRTFAQSTGGTIVGVIIRALCIGASTAMIAKIGAKAGSKAATKISELINPDKLDKAKDAFKFQDKMSSWGKSVGGAVAIGVMLVTNFLIDAPFINWINKKVTGVVDKLSAKKQENQAKEVK